MWDLEIGIGHKACIWSEGYLTTNKSLKHFLIINDYLIGFVGRLVSGYLFWPHNSLS